MRPVILHCIDSLTIGGAEVLLKNTIPLLKDYDHVICYLNGPEDLVDSFSAYPLYKLDHNSWADTFRTVKRLKKIIRKHKAAILHAHLFNSTLIARFACPGKTKFVFTIHNPLSRDAFMVNKKSLYAEKWTYKKRQHIIAVSKLVLKDYDEWVGIKGPAYVLYNHVEEKFFKLTYDYNKSVEERFRLVAVGNLRRQKNYFVLIEALAQLKGYPVSVDVFGEGDLRQALQKKIEDTGVNMRLMGRVNEITGVLENYDAYIMPSIFEGYGIAPMEAMAAGMPVLLSDLEVFREIAGDLPVYFNPLDSGSIARALIFSRENWDLVKEKAKNSRSIVYEKASKEKYLLHLEEIYSRILNSQ